jgi:hypothetical protein
MAGENPVKPLQEIEFLRRCHAEAGNRAAACKSRTARIVSGASIARR